MGVMEVTGMTEVGRGGGGKILADGRTDGSIEFGTRGPCGCYEPTLMHNYGKWKYLSIKYRNMKVKQGVRNPVVKCEVRHFPTVISGHFSPSYPHKGAPRRYSFEIFGWYLRDISSIFQPKENIIFKFIPDFRHSASIWFYLAVFFLSKIK